jgi:Uma2 family endonuclease
MRGLDLDRRIVSAPALAVEVVSPADLAQELAHRVDQYLAAGVRVVWVVYPNTREVHVFREGGQCLCWDRITLLKLLICCQGSQPASVSSSMICLNRHSG